MNSSQFYAPTALQSRSEPSALPRSRNRPQATGFLKVPLGTLRDLAVKHDLVTLTDFSMTKGGVVGNVGSAVFMVASVILDSSAVRI